jgi:hypothetical protein
VVSRAPTVYLAVNPAWPSSWVKVGVTETRTARLAAYNHGTPLKDFSFAATFDLPSMPQARAVERTVLSLAREDAIPAKGEWLNTTTERALGLVQAALKKEVP